MTAPLLSPSLAKLHHGIPRKLRKNANKHKPGVLNAKLQSVEKDCSAFWRTSL